MKNTVLVLLLISVFMVGCGGGGAGDKADKAGSGGPPPYPNVPGTESVDANKNLAILMATVPSASISPAPWAGYWWPFSTDGISDAAVKYEAANESIGALNWEVTHHGNGLGAVADWWGHCNGWAAAAVLTPEPREARDINGITFGVSDRKALLSETFMEVTGDFIGTRSDFESMSSEAFNDVWPAQFFLVLTSIMGVQKRAVVIDRYTGSQVWNQPLVAYVTQPVTREDYLGPDPEFPNIHRVNMTTTVFWVDDNVDPGSLTPPFSLDVPNDVFPSRTLKYELWLDAEPQFDGNGALMVSGNIILHSENGRTTGGIWKNSSLPSVNSHPDYLWMPTGAAASSGFKNPNITDDFVLSRIK